VKSNKGMFFGHEKRKFAFLFLTNGIIEIMMKTATKSFAGGIKRKS
jgi:hypothetical protein